MYAKNNLTWIEILQLSSSTSCHHKLKPNIENSLKLDKTWTAERYLRLSAFIFWLSICQTTWLKCANLIRQGVLIEWPCVEPGRWIFEAHRLRLTESLFAASGVFWAFLDSGFQVWMTLNKLNWIEATQNRTLFWEYFHESDYFDFWNTFYLVTTNIVITVRRHYMNLRSYHLFEYFIAVQEIRPSCLWGCVHGI